MEKEGTRPRGKEGDKLQTWEIRFVDKERKRERQSVHRHREREREGEKGEERVLLAREANKAFVPASSLDTQIKSFCREPGLFPLYANQRHTAAR